jgi:hypothetical protein
MGKLIRISLRDVPLRERAKAASRLMVDEPGEAPKFLLAALNPSTQTYFITDQAHRAWTSRRSASAR